MSAGVFSSTFITGSRSNYVSPEWSFSSGLELERLNTKVSSGSRISCCMKVRCSWLFIFIVGLEPPPWFLIFCEGVCFFRHGTLSTTKSSRHCRTSHRSPLNPLPKRWRTWSPEIGSLAWNLTRWVMYVEKIAGCRDTTTEDTGHCGNYRCLDAQKHPRFSKKSMNARRHTQMLIFVCLLLTTRNSPSACRLSSTNPMLSKCKIGRTISLRPSLHVSFRPHFFFPQFLAPANNKKLVQTFHAYGYRLQ